MINNFNQINEDDMLWIENNSNFFLLNITKTNEFLSRLVEINNRIKGRTEHLSNCGACVKSMIDFVWARYQTQI